MRNIAITSVGLVALAISACGGSSDGNGEEITVAYVNNEITSEMPPPGSYTATGTELVCDDGYQGNSIDIGRVIVSKINSSSNGETLAVAFSHKLSATPVSGTFAAFYIDTDNDPLTGLPVTGSDNVTIGADVLFLDLHSFDTNGSSSITYSSYHVWSQSLSQWQAQSDGYSTASYYEGISINKSVFASNSSGVVDLLALTTSVTGVFTAQYIPSGDPNAVVSTVDATDTFSFNMPS